jgi:hypothetical protein
MAKIAALTAAGSSIHKLKHYRENYRLARQWSGVLNSLLPLPNYTDDNRL